MFIINHRKIFFLISGLLVLGAAAALVTYGLKLGTDFTGGTIMEVEYREARPELVLIKSQIDALALGQVSLQTIGERSILLRLRTITEDEHQTLGQTLGGLEKRYSSIGPAVGEELARKGIIAVIIVVGLIILYIAFVFRHARPTGSSGRISKPVNSWKYGLIAILALIHDIAIPTGLMALLGRFYGVEADALFLTALLTILGLSVNDTIVVFDRIRENLKQQTGEKFDEVVGRSLNETIVRSINTSFTVILALLAIYFFGGASTKYFALVMAVGMFVGTYSSIFIASPLLVSWQKWGERVK
ncbi:MAG: protein translocase subunit SecF [Candidatus Vogelbacteria bacterium]|nr:protein translocase subunit SecF [Candidatus Vogelbacteria bacterium]